MRGNVKSLGLIFLLLAANLQAAPPEEPPRGEWSSVLLTPRLLALTGDYSELQRRLFHKRMAERRAMTRRQLPGWAKEFRFNISGTEAIAMYRPQVVGMLRDAPKVRIQSDRGEISVLRTGYWMSPIGQSRFPDDNGRERLSLNADAAHYLFLELSRPVEENETLRITLPAGETVTHTRKPGDPSPIFRINQLGYMPKAPKFAYLGAWLGTAGALPMHQEFSGKTFDVVDAATGRSVFTGTLKARRRDPVTPKGTPFTGEEVLELDFSQLETPGRYFLVVPGVGRSWDFRIGDETMAEAFYIHARGLYHQRCGIAKEKPYTNWTMPICHKSCVRGTFPPDISHYSAGGKGKCSYGFTNDRGKGIKVKPFALIDQNRPAKPEVLNFPGGWHDAADWDRRPMHLGIVGDLAAIYLLKPDNFCDGQLNIPESGNGIPDILDEARWGIEHLRLKQQPDGGVGTWIETSRHPNAKDGSSADDRLTYYQSCATRDSTLEYAAYAAELALAFKQAGAEKLSKEYCDSAKRAWDFALDPKNRAKHTYSYYGKTIFYREEKEPSPEYWIKAGFDLFQLTGDNRFLDGAERAAKAALDRMKTTAWRWSPFLWIELEIFPCYSGTLNKLRTERRRSLTAQAKKMLVQQETNYPIRIPWYSTAEGWAHTMGWGVAHPLRRALVLIAAHAMTGDPDFLNGAYLANDFHNGANPFGSTMTSGLGRVYPVRFLSLDSYADGIAEFIPGITPYRTTYGIPRPAIKMVYGLFYRANPGQKFAGLSQTLLPKPGLDEDACVREINKLFPIWRRWGNVEALTVAASEFTVWETIAPAAAATGYMLNGARQPDPEWKNRRPAEDIRKLPGYAPLP